MYKRTNIELDTELIKQAMDITHLSTIKDVVHHALKEIIKADKTRDCLILKVRWYGRVI
jgi:Arc/MetJ family transcription regulator